MSPEGATYGIEEYAKTLSAQAEIAEAFYYGRIGEGIEGLMNLPEDVRLKIDQLIWDAAGGQPIDATDEASADLIADAILFSLEERMGLHAS